MLLPSGHQAVAHSLNLETTALLGPHILLPYGQQAVAHSLNLETTALLGPHILLPYGQQAVAHCLNLGTTALLLAFCASYAIALWPPSCGPQPQLGDY